MRSFNRNAFLAYLSLLLLIIVGGLQSFAISEESSQPPLQAAPAADESAQSPLRDTAEAETDRPATLPPADLNITSTEINARYMARGDVESFSFNVRGSLPRPLPEIIGYHRTVEITEIAATNDMGIPVPTWGFDQGVISPVVDNAAIYLPFRELTAIPDGIALLRGNIVWLVRKEAMRAIIDLRGEPGPHVETEWMDVYVDEDHRQERQVNLTLRFRIKKLPLGNLTPAAIERFVDVSVFDAAGTPLNRRTASQAAGRRLNMPRLMYTYHRAEQEPMYAQLLIPTAFETITQEFAAHDVRLPRVR